MNSRNTAESTGKLPPTPMPSIPKRTPSVVKFCDPPAAMANTPEMKSVILNAHRLPTRSHPRPQNAAPTKNPMFAASERKGGRK